MANFNKSNSIYTINAYNSRSGLNYVFNGFINYKPKFEPVTCIELGAKQFKRRIAAEKNIARLEHIFRNKWEYSFSLEEYVKEC